MSFSGTPLGQQRRLDQQAFLKQNHNSTARASPKKPPSSQPDFTQDNALARFARIKEQQQQQHPQLEQHGSHPVTFTSPPHSPEKWAQKDTSVNIASAFHQAAEQPIPETMNVPRSTSVEYEQQSQSTVNRRLGNGPSSSRQRPTNPSVSARKPLSSQRTNNSLLNGGRPVATSNDSASLDDIDHSTGRAKSPLSNVLDAASQSFSRVSYYVRQRSTEPNTSTSYDYSAEDREVEERDGRARPSKISAVHKKNKMSIDNKAYRPEVSDESDDEDFDEDDDRRKRKKKGGKGGPPLHNLPVLTASKGRKRKPKKKNEAGGEQEEEEDEAGASGSDLSRTRQERQTSLPPPDPFEAGDSTLEPTLDSIPEEPFDLLPPPAAAAPLPPKSSPAPRRRSRSRSRTREIREKKPFSIGGLMGHALRPVYWTFSTIFQVIMALMDLAGRLLGMVFGVTFARPYTWFTRSKVPIGRYLLSILALFGAWLLLKNSGGISLPHLDWESLIPARSASSGFEGVPPETLNKLLSRLASLEKTVASLPDSSNTKSTDDLVSRLGMLEGRVQREAERAVKAEQVVGSELRDGLHVLRADLQSVVHKQETLASQPPPDGREGLTPEEKEKMKKLEEKVVEVESGLSKALAADTKKGTWWDVLTSGKSSDLTIKAADGTDVSKLIERLVQDSVLSDNGFHQADFASYSAGGRIIPHLTSETYSISPPTLPSKILGVLTGSGSAIARPPVTALHHDVQNGYCWAMPGSKGQLGVALSRVVKPSGFVVEHVRAELATDKDPSGASRKSAPKEIEIWGQVEGKENIQRVNEWRKESTDSEEMARLDPRPPSTIGRGFMKLVNFTFELEGGAPSAQFFPVEEHIKELGIDFGVVVFRIMGNHGRKEWTCLYRVRVFGDVAV